MSADNGTFVLKTTDENGGFEYRVIHCQSIDNIYGQYIASSKSWLPNKEAMIDYFGKSKVFTNEDDAFEEAFQIDNEVGYSEYGVSLIAEFQQYSFRDFGE